MMSEQLTTFAGLLQRYRLAAGLSQEALAERAGLSVAAISSLERGRRTAPRPDTVALLAEALQLEAHDRAALIAAALARDPGMALTPAIAVPPAVARVTSRLPVPPTRLIGREHEAAAIAHLLQWAGSSRLVTLTGPGGVGKTRLALAVAQDLQDRYPDGAVFVDLSALHDPALVATTVAMALGLREAGAQSARDLLLSSLRAKKALLVLDNFEQVVEAALLVADLVEASPRLAVLVTSRTVLRVRAEQQFHVPPLATPGPGGASSRDAAEYAALRLFTARAQAVQPSFELDVGNAEAVAEICRRLDGLPLALELAAARVSLLPPAALLGRLERRLGVLKGGARDLPERQQTLRAAIDWSYALLSSWEQALLRRLSVFAGGCTLEAAEAVAILDEATDGDVLAGVEMLVNHSMLQSVDSQDGAMRFRMLETIREYGREQLAATGEEAEVRRRHAAYYLTLAEEAKSRLFGADQMSWLDLLEREHDNLRETLADARARGDAEQGARLAGALWRFWYIRCHLGEGRGWLRQFAALPMSPDGGAAARADVLAGLSVIAYAQTDYDTAAVAAEECVALARSLDDRPNLVLSLNILGGVARYRSDFGRAAALGEECVALTRAIGDRWSLALSLNNLAEVARFQGAYERAGALAGESLDLARALEDRWGIAEALLTMGRLARDRGEYGAATALHEQSLAIVRELGHTRDIAFALAGLGHVACAEGNHDRATELFEQSLAVLRPLGDTIRMAHILTALGRARHTQGDDGQATSLHRESLALFRTVGSTLGLAESLEGLAAVAGAVHTQEQAERAARLLATAAALREAIGSPLAPADRSRYERDLAGVRATLGDDAFAAAWAAGAALPLDYAIDEAMG
ncbi:MAG TPA: tetratricopeptide repeat protein [Chloroflexota bacterium]|nr:tetratricopeptide repeat protein [Chloroflexota bacterium]